MRVGVSASFVWVLGLLPAISHAQTPPASNGKQLAALLDEHCDSLPLMKALVPVPPEKREKNGQYTQGVANIPDGIDMRTTGYLLRSECHGLLFLEDKVRVPGWLAKQGVSTILSDIRLMMQIRSTLLHPAYADKTGDVMSRHVRDHAERALARLLSLPLKDENGRDLLSREERAQLLRSPAEIAQTLPSKQFADADTVQKDILYKASQQDYGATRDRVQQTEVAEQSKPAQNSKDVFASAAPLPLATLPAKMAGSKSAAEVKTAAQPAAGANYLPPTPNVSAAPALPRNLADMKRAQPKIERAVAPALSSAPVPGAQAASAHATVAPGEKVEGVAPGSYPGRTPDGKPCTVLIQKEGQWYGKRVPMFKAQIIVGDLKPGSSVSDNAFAEMSFGQQSPTTAAASSIKAHTTVGELLALRREGKLLPDPVVRSKSLSGDNLSAFVESYAYKYDRAGDRRVNEKGELVRNIGARGEATVHLVRQKTAMAAKVKNGFLTEMTLTTHSGTVDQDVSSGSYEQWRRNAVGGAYDAPSSITCLTDKAASEPKPAAASESH